MFGSWGKWFTLEDHKLSLWEWMFEGGTRTVLQAFRAKSKLQRNIMKAARSGS